ncbi:hypothetical protein FACS1894142_7540 [Spirochaetia bacterium]|nr:hypothetical protein FACS1894142_7540 [Spirochaetia bacterium]
MSALAAGCNGSDTKGNGGVSLAAAPRLSPIGGQAAIGVSGGNPGDLTPNTDQDELKALMIAAAAGDSSAIFLKEGTDGTDDGVARLLDGLQNGGISFYKQGNNGGLIAADDVVLIKINSQWAERGGTNTDVLKGIIQYIVGHPDGFTGEVIIADNGQSMFGSARTGGNLDWDNTNAKDRTQSAQDVADYFDARGYHVSGVLWDKMTRTRVNEFEAGDAKDGFVVEAGEHATGLVVSYAKFTTKYGARVSFKKGIWDGTRYDSNKLKVINAPVLKSHGQYQVTGAMKSYMGTPSNSLTNMSPHNSVGRGGMGAQMVMTRFPIITILDMVWITPDGGPGSSYSRAVAKNMIAASTDPVALDYWASKNVLIPAAQASGNRRYTSMNPDSTEPGSFGYWLRLSMAELEKGGFPATMDESKMRVIRVN